MSQASAQSRLTDLHEAAAAAVGRSAPPVHLWDPPNCGEIDIRILADGRWLHEGSPIERPALVRLFASVLRRDPDGFHLVTPVEKLRITVDDAPFIAVACERHEGLLRFATNTGDVVEAGSDNPIRVDTGPAGDPRPYVHVRRGLDALILRPVFYELVALAEPRQGEGGMRLSVRSGACWFDLGSLKGAA